ncbi:MAG: methyltransferase domain-containing protein [Xanthomonadaceae bacterium]|nr:methyltransferase domain-containing protein [Xanthomonadaceae bacterium]
MTECMLRVPLSEINGDFQRDLCWGDDERHLYNPNRRKESAMAHMIRLEEVIHLVEKHSPGKKVADFACAQGNFGLLLAEKGFEVTAVDLKEEFLNYAKMKHEKGSFKTLQANLMEFQSPEKFDCILAGVIIEHCAFPHQLLSSIARNLKSGGITVLTTPNGAEFNSPLPTYKQVTNIEELFPKQFHWGDHLFLFTVQELRKLFDQNGFDVITVIKLNRQYFSQLKGPRYFFPIRILSWFERLTRSWKKGGKDSTNCLILVAQKR